MIPNDESAWASFVWNAEPAIHHASAYGDLMCILVVLYLRICYLNGFRHGKRCQLYGVMLARLRPRQKRDLFRRPSSRAKLGLYSTLCPHHTWYENGMYCFLAWLGAQRGIQLPATPSKLEL